MAVLQNTFGEDIQVGFPGMSLMVGERNRPGGAPGAADASAHATRTDDALPQKES